jgi:hypothetical protein
MKRSPWSARVAGGVALALLVSLGACGGGSSGGGSTPAPGSQTGSLTLGLAGGAPAGYSHVWVTVDSVALNTDADRPWSTSDSSWQVIHLDTPQTVDLAASVNGVIAPLLTGKVLPATTYGQLRLFLLHHDDPLSSSAQSLQLLFNDEVDSVDAAGSTHRLPLELTDAGLGLRVAGAITIGANVASSLTLQWDLEHSAVRFASDDGVDRVTMRPDLKIFDIAQTGAIVGLVDKSLFCPTGVRSGCVYDVVASAESVSADGRFMVSVRSTPVVVGDTYAQFALYPLPALADGGTFDVVIRGRNMRTIVVRAVPASAADLLAASPTQIGVDMTDKNNPVAIPLVPQLSAPGDSLATLNVPTVPASAQLMFGQTLPGSGDLPHEVIVTNADPFTGLLAQPVVLPGGPLVVGTYASGGPIAFSDATPQEGGERYSLVTLGTRYDEPSAIGTVLAPGGSTVSLTAPVTMRKGGTEVAPLTVDITGGSTQTFDAAELVVSDVGGIVATQDVSSLIGVSGAHAALQLPAGAIAAAQGGTAVYSVAVRAWKRGAVDASLQWGRAPSVVDLRSASSATITVSLP